MHPDIHPRCRWWIACKLYEAKINSVGSSWKSDLIPWESWKPYWVYYGKFSAGYCSAWLQSDEVVWCVQKTSWSVQACITQWYKSVVFPHLMVALNTLYLETDTVLIQENLRRAVMLIKTINIFIRGEWKVEIIYVEDGLKTSINLSPKARFKSPSSTIK